MAPLKLLQVAPFMETLRNSCFPHIQSRSLLQNKYKEEGKKEMSSSLYSQLPETAEMQLAKAVQEFQSEVRFSTFQHTVCFKQVWLRGCR